MSIYRVVVSFMINQLHFQQERGVKAMSPGQALDDVLTSLAVDMTKVESFKTFVEKPASLDAFNYDTKNMICINSRNTVADVWNRRYGS